MYSNWASTFGKPEQGAQAADKAVRLDPRYLAWQARSFSHAYFMAGRDNDALRMLERLSPEQWNRNDVVRRAAVYAALGQAEETRAALAETLKRYPDVTIQEYVSSADWGDGDRQRLIETMRKAGFPACVKPESLAKMTKPVRLPDCPQSLPPN